MSPVNHGYVASVVMRRTVQVLSTISVILPSYFVIRHLIHRFRMVEPEGWPTTSPRWMGEDKEKLLFEEIPAPKQILNLNDIIKKSSQFSVPFPIETVRCSYLKPRIGEEVLKKYINSAYPVIHEQALLLCAIFLNYQVKFGNTEFYKNMTLLELVDRLLSKRAVAFVEASDQYLLRGGQKGAGGWESVGTPEEVPPLILEECLSYDEIKLAALLSVSSHSHFINDGSRNNFGEFKPSKRVEENGVIIGLIGARLEKENVMEYREIVKTKEQNIPENGYGSQGIGQFSVPTLQGKFSEFYGDDNATYEELLDKLKSSPERYTYLRGDRYFDKLMFERRISLSIDTLLIEANDRAEKENKKAYIHVVGLGLGVWKITREQDKIFMDTFAKRLDFLKDKLPHISDIRFAYIRHDSAGSYKDGDYLNGIKIHIENKNPQEKLNDDGKLLVVSFPWDGNAFPGNEFWFGPENLSASGDPAAASSSQIAELHNYYINGKVRASNLRVATLNHGLVTFQDYQKLHSQDSKSSSN